MNIVDNLAFGSTMHMSLYWNTEAGPIVFEWWRVESVLGLSVSVGVALLLAILLEWVNRRLMKMSKFKKYRYFIYALKYTLSAFNMLILMTFNGWMILALICGSGLGYALFNAPSSNDDEFENDACHC